MITAENDAVVRAEAVMWAVKAKDDGWLAPYGSSGIASVIQVGDKEATTMQCRSVQSILKVPGF